MSEHEEGETFPNSKRMDHRADEIESPHFLNAVDNENHEQELITNRHHYDSREDFKVEYSDEDEQHEIAPNDNNASSKKRQFLNMLWDIAYNMTIVGGTSFRGAVVQLMTRFCDKAKWLTENEFMEVYMMSHIVPGPKPSQIAMALAMPKYGFIGGILSYLFFSIPGFIVCLILGLSMYDYDNSTAPTWFINAQKGLACSGIAFALQSMSRFSSMLDNEKKTKGQPKKEKKPEMFPYILLTIVAIVTLLYRKTWLLPVLLVIGAILSVIYCEIRDRTRKRIEEFGLIEKIGSKSYEDMKLMQKLNFFKLFFQSFIPKYARQMREIELLEERKEEEPVDEINNNPFAKMASIKIGIFLVILFFILLGCVIGASLIVESNSTIIKLSNQQERRQISLWTEWIIVSSFFFKSGSLIFNGAVVNVVIIRDEMLERGWITSDQFISGYSLTNVAPGPRFNLGFYFGTVIAGNLLNSNYTASLYLDTNSTQVDAKSNLETIHANRNLNNELETNDSLSPFTKLIVALAYSMVAGLSFHAPGFLLLLGIVPLWGSLRSKPIVQKAMNGINAVCVGYLINNIVILWISVVGTSVPLAAVSILGFALVNWIDFWHPMVVFVGAIATILLGFIVPI